MTNHGKNNRTAVKKQGAPEPLGPALPAARGDVGGPCRQRAPAKANGEDCRVSLSPLWGEDSSGLCVAELYGGHRLICQLLTSGSDASGRCAIAWAGRPRAVLPTGTGGGPPGRARRLPGHTLLRALRRSGRHRRSTRRATPSWSAPRFPRANGPRAAGRSSGGS